MRKPKDKWSIADESLSPTTKARYVGIEIEFFSPIDRDVVLEKFFESPVASHVQLTSDGSLDWDVGEDDSVCSACHNSMWDSCQCDMEPYELKVLCKQSELVEVMKGVCAVLKNIKAQVNETCGLHVHLDMRHRNARKCYQNLAAVQSVLYKMCTADRLLGEYCMPVASLDLEKQQLRGSRERYFGINTQALLKYSTLEVRIHHGTIEEQNIVNWVSLLLRVINTRKTLKEPVRNVVQLKKHVPLHHGLLSYICEETGKHMEQHEKAHLALDGSSLEEVA